MNTGDLFEEMPEPRPWRSDGGRTAEVEVETVRVSDSGDALLVRDGTARAWIPLSLIEEPEAAIEVPSECATLTIPEWLAIREGLV